MPVGSARRRVLELVNRSVPDRYFITRCNKDRNGVYLTFDDSPHARWTRVLLDLLGDLGIQATFFLVAQDAMRQPDIVRDIAERGHTIGNHTYSHRSVVGLGAKDLEVEIVESGKRLSDLSGQNVKMFRPPWGKIDLKSVRYLILKGQQIVLWSVDSTDYRKVGAGDIVSRIERVGVRAGDVLLFHDDNEFTIEALPDIVASIRRKGLEFSNFRNH
jgi:peptidoglycan/xylan/chitin deacetylase (PgdA/CDA1 family)